MTLFSSHLSLSAGKDGGYREEGLLGLSPSISPSLDVRGGEGREGRGGRGGEGGEICLQNGNDREKEAGM